LRKYPSDYNISLFLCFEKVFIGTWSGGKSLNWHALSAFL
jgi:hypothetical protein